MKEIKIIENIFENKGFNTEDRYDFYRFWSNVEIKDRVDTCWNWTRYISPNGYGRFTWIRETAPPQDGIYFVKRSNSR